MEIQPGCDPAAGTGCTGLIAQAHTGTHTYLGTLHSTHSQTTSKSPCPAQVDLAGVGAEVEVEVGVGLFTSS